MLVKHAAGERYHISDMMNIKTQTQ